MIDYIVNQIGRGATYRQTLEHGQNFGVDGYVAEGNFSVPTENFLDLRERLFGLSHYAMWSAIINY